ncbi:hypothetical protein B0T10DRAFT_582520 [Thelonectria olida]|uniref:Zn(2)-C6 fungal-type domain-containing protein n=1 Tax=Thelonectria olida TaxID=1576542 RepID=A0A9P8VXE8_9HYPO|nr:hypothetical protein B0T10DRAFT_582520 [Thelonectria olida]
MPPRRTHTKSRTGCANCKRRKVKCDEAYPICFNCERHGVPCSLSTSTPNVSLNDRSATTPAHSGDGNAARSRNDVAVTSASEQIAPFPPQELLSQDFELLHHYCTKEMTHVWRICIPREGYQHSFVMHGVLAISAAHKAYLMPSNRQTYLSLLDYHQTVGSEGFRSALQNICPEIGIALFSFASIVVLYLYTLPNRFINGQLEDPIRNMSEIIVLLRGIKTALAPLMPGVLRSELASLIYGIWPLDFGEPGKQSLECSAKLIALAGAHIETGAVLAWMYGIHESILMDIRSHRPHALVILAYYSVFLATLEKRFWYARGWAR